MALSTSGLDDATVGLDDATEKLIKDLFSRLQNENKELRKSIQVTIHEALQKEFTQLQTRLDEQEQRLMDVDQKTNLKPVTSLVCLPL